MAVDHKPLRRERKFSTSSSASSISTSSSSISGMSTHSAPSHAPSERACLPPVRAASAPLILTTPPPSPFQHAVISRQVPSVHHVQGSHTPPTYDHTPVPVLPQAHFPLVNTDPRPHPHFFYNSLPQFNTLGPDQPHPCHTPHTSVTMETSWRPTERVPLKSEWQDTRPFHHTTSQLTRPPLHNDLIGCPPPTPPTPSGIGGCGPAQDFYSFLNEASNNNVTTPTSSQNINIWTPPSDDQPHGEGLGVWPKVLH